jgi:hypothetical protein
VLDNAVPTGAYAGACSDLVTGFGAFGGPRASRPPS